LLVSEFMTALIAFALGWSLLHLPPALMAEYRKSGKRQTQQRLVNFIGALRCNGSCHVSQFHGSSTPTIQNQ
jgi:hypothetical protein